MAKNVFAGVGISYNDDPFAAGKEAVEKAIDEMKNQGGKKPTFGIVFCSGGKYGKDDKTIKKLVDGAHSIFGNTPWVGCTGGGEISPYGSTKNSVVAMSISSEYVRFGIGIGSNALKKPKEAGKKAVQDAFNSIKLDVQIDSYLQYMRTKKHKPSEILKMVPYAILLLGKGPVAGLIPGIPNMYDLEGILEGVLEECGFRVPVIGGGSYDDWAMKRNYHFANGEVYKDAIIVVAIMSNTYFSSGLAHGYNPTGKVAFVNKTSKMGGTVFVDELNKKNAVEVYAEMTNIPIEELKKDSIEAGALQPFGIIDPFGESWVRVPGKVIMGKLGMTPRLKENTAVQLMKGTEDSVFKANAEAVQKALKEIENKKPAVVFMFSCACRNKYFKERIGKEIEIFKKYFPGVPFIGFYSFCEFGGTMGYRMGIHNQSVTAFVISDEIMV